MNELLSEREKQMILPKQILCKLNYLILNLKVFYTFFVFLHESVYHLNPYFITCFFECTQTSAKKCTVVLYLRNEMLDLKDLQTHSRPK